MKMDQYFIMFTRGRATVRKLTYNYMNSLLCWMAIWVTLKNAGLFWPNFG